MPVVPLAEIPADASGRRYGAPAVHVFADLTLQAVLGAAQDVGDLARSPVMLFRGAGRGGVTPVPALVFDCDGVLADTERYGHLPAFNRTFAEFGLPVRWSDAQYAQKVQVGGGKERMRTLLTPEFVAKAGLPADPEALDAEVARWHRRKTEIYTGIIAGGTLPPRPGVRRLAEEAHADGWRLVVASTSAEPSVRSVLELAAGPELARRFAVFAGDVVPHKKPAPDVYEYAVTRLGVDPRDALVVEDTRNGLLAAIGAGLTCAVTTSAYSGQEDFTGAALVVTSLGDPGPDTVVTHVLADPFGADPRPFVRLSDLRFLLAAATGPGPR